MKVKIYNIIISNTNYAKIKCQKIQPLFHCTDLWLHENKSAELVQTVI